MKIATSSASFSAAFEAGTLTQLEWLDICANELEVDGVVFDARDFPRDDSEYLAQLKKFAADLGLSVAALDIGASANVDRMLEIALALGAPLVMIHAPLREDSDIPPANEAAQAWGNFTARAKAAAAHAKRANVTLAMRSLAGTLCANAADCIRLAKDVDSTWLRFALDPAPPLSDNAAWLLSKTVIAPHAIADIACFASPADREATLLIETLARFRGFILLEADLGAAHRTAYHEALTRFARFRSDALVMPSSA